MPQPAHYAKNIVFACIDDRLVETHLKFIIQVGGAFFAAVAGGGLAFVDPETRPTALRQVTAAYTINHVDHVYLESHMDCGAYLLAGYSFKSRYEEIDRLYADLDAAALLIRAALAEAGADEITIDLSVVDPMGRAVNRNEVIRSHAH